MKITAVNGSPRGMKSNSGEVIRLLQKSLPQDAVWYEAQARGKERPTPESLTSEILLIAFPLYVDGLPSGLIRWLQEYRDLCHVSPVDQKVYAVANCGFHEGEQNQSALAMVEAFAEAAGLTWCGGVGIGTGEMIRGLKSVPPEAGIRRPVITALKTIGAAMEEQTALKENLYTRHNLPWLIYKITGEAGWRSQVRKNEGRTKDLSVRPFGV